MLWRAAAEVAMELAQVNNIADYSPVIHDNDSAVKGRANQGAKPVLGIHPSAGDVT